MKRFRIVARVTAGLPAPRDCFMCNNNSAASSMVPPETSKNIGGNVFGTLGEEIAADFLKRKGWTILARNRLYKFGELDIVARETDTIHVVEVKTVTHETRKALEWAVTHETWRPEELVHSFKLNQIRKATEAWILEEGWNGKVQIDVAAIRLVLEDKFAVVNLIENVEI